VATINLSVRRVILPVLVLLLCVSAARPLAGQRGGSSAADAIRIPFEILKLPNGLTVILSTDKSTPTVAVNIWYHVGSKNEIPGRTGFAHLFEHVMFAGSGHVPYGLHDKLTEASVKAITRDDVVALHKAYYQPGRAIITVVGDVSPAAVKGTIERIFAAWPKAGEKPSFNYLKLPEGRATTIYLVDKPGAAQSVFNIGLPGPPRNTPDYFALQVLNHILGGQFQSRLNYNIREMHGYSYGVNSSFAYGRGPGAFRAGGAIVSAKTDAALSEFMKELRGIVRERPVTDEELQTAKDALIQGLPRSFVSVSAIGNAITNLTVQGLPDDYYQGYAKGVSAVTKEDLLRVAKTYIDLDHLAIVIVGDRASIEGPLKATGIAPVLILDLEANPVSSSSNPGNKPLNTGPPHTFTFLSAYSEMR